MKKNDEHHNADYCLFAGHCFYLKGGSDDFKSFGTVDELKTFYAKNANAWSKDVGGYPDPWGIIAKRSTMKSVLSTSGHEMEGIRR